MLPCPRCSLTMTRRAGQHGMSWSCPACGGRAATLAVLRAAFERQTVNELWVGSASSQAPAGASCPSCRRSMRGVRLLVLGGTQILDVCRACHFVWFDPGEWQAMPEREAPEAGVRVRPRDPQVAEALVRFQLEHAREMSQHAAGGAAESGPDSPWKWLPGLLGMPVELDRHVGVRRPWATWGLLASLLIVAGLVFSHLDVAVRDFGFVPADPWRRGGVTWLTSFFLHGGWMHLLGNAYFLWIFGDNVEHVTGVGRFLVLVLAATLLGDALHAVTTDTPELPCVGASGGISGVIAYYALRFPRARLGVLFFYVHWLSFSARTGFVIWVALQLLGAWTASSHVAHTAHLGGAAAGLALFVWDRLRQPGEASGVSRRRRPSP